MNNKRTNRIVAILNILSILSIYMLAILTKYLSSNAEVIIPAGNSGKIIYDSFIIDTLINEEQK